LHAVDLQSGRSLDNHVASGNYSVIGGGQANTASGQFATVGGGSANTASGTGATVGGGGNNIASALGATVGGGGSNTATAQYATIGGGVYNYASGNYSVVPGGNGNSANGAYNLVFGENVGPSVTETHRVYFFGNGSTSPSRPSGFLVINRLDGDFPIHVGTNTGNGNGAYLSGGGMWTNTSSRSFKERFVQYRPAEVLEKIRQLPVEGYFYKGTEEYHITPMAEDFYRLFGTGAREIIETDSTGQLVRRPNPDVDKYLAASDVAGVALLGVQALAERMDMLQPQSGALAQRLEALEQENQQIKQENQQIKQENQQIKQENQRFRQQLEQVMERLALVEAQLQQGGSTAGENAWLGQSIPNPTDGTVVIPYYVPAAAGAAELVVWNSAGAEVVRQPLPLRGQPGQVRLEMQQFASGVYQYGLVVNGRLVAQRQMVVAR
jgi:regulator of replication initiation timing